MASTSSSISTLEQQPEAGPLPVKRGEIGFSEELHGQSEQTRATTPIPTLPIRHPADRDAAPDIGANPTPSSPSSGNPSYDPSWSSKPFMSFWKSNTTLGGVQLATLLAFLVQLFLLVGTISAWIAAAQYLSRAAAGGPMASSSVIFVHVIFAVGILGQLLFLERRIYRLRAERYAFLRSDEILPTYHRQASVNTTMSYAPWHRPPLPTYAAALAQSGVGTGDVEDHIIAAPPPPAYGNTRGSTLLLRGFLRESLRAQRPIQDEQWEAIQDAERARKLEETLARLERPVSAR
ncbi:uncharacterized protein BT62DRAFT_175163 [Guyanagaster necrorhizus]|uniref:Uncharacterized protein n=1 Tax=Guyanagaster necrorhizus TaxID=856835 RepID=A0A9P8ATB5_9AGAR|nr:uncharacterized protein BT62DRAFT_175163 [Guyanagaster necrorhizus MCA 3950]KAG7445717.1 hypothetical protein BT62DRAFT_175163 [Guyanagaster necrorhizus MCA 3950]